MNADFSPVVLVAVVIALCTCIGATTASAQITVINGRGATLEDLAGTETYVTVVLRGSRARDRNLKVIEVGKNHVSVRLLSGDRISYLFSQIHEVRVQGGLIGSEGPVQISDTRALRPEEKEAVANAVRRAQEILPNRQLPRDVRMRAAAVLAAGDQGEGLQALAALTTKDTDLALAIEATLHIYIAGGDVNPDLVLDGLASGNRDVRSTAARIAGLVGDPRFERGLIRILQDITTETFPDAAKATGRMKIEKGIPHLLRAMASLNDQKAESAVFALSEIGGEEVRDAMREIVDTGERTVWYRAVKVLYAMGDEEAGRIMREQCLTSPAFARETAIILTKDGDWEASLYLRKHITERRDPNRENLIYRAQAAAALVQSGDVQANKVLRQLLGMKEKNIFKRGKASDTTYKAETLREVQVSVCKEIVDIGDRDLISLAGPAVINPIPEVAIAGCEAVMAIANPGFGQRLKDARS